MLKKELCLLTQKPTFYVFNQNALKNKENNISPEKAGIQENYIIFDAKLENELSQLSSQEMTEFNLLPSSLDRLIKACYDTLNLITFFTFTKGVELRAWTVRQGAKAPQAAGIIHTDFEKGFIKAEIVSYDDFVSAGSEAKAREKGLLRQEGKNYAMQDGDIVNFKFNP